jgi:hypothetical protein
MPYAVASIPQTFVVVLQHVRAVENASGGQAGSSGGGGVHVPLTMLPHEFVAVSQHATGGVFDRPGLAGAGVQVTVPHVTVAGAAVPAAPAEVPAVTVPVPAAPVPAVTVPVPATVPVVPAVMAGVPLAAAAPAVT